MVACSSGEGPQEARTRENKIKKNREQVFFIRVISGSDEMF
jgi:hypothetical protein